MHTVKELPPNTSLNELYQTQNYITYAIVDEDGNVLKSAGIYHIYDRRDVAESAAREFNENLASRKKSD
jgi:hypothetical protein